MNEIFLEWQSIKAYALGVFTTWFFLWKYRGYRKIKTYMIKEI